MLFQVLESLPYASVIKKTFFDKLNFLVSPNYCCKVELDSLVRIERLPGSSFLLFFNPELVNLQIKVDLLR